MSEIQNKTLAIHLADHRKELLRRIQDAQMTERVWGILASPLHPHAYYQLTGKLMAFDQMTEIVKGMGK